MSIPSGCLSADDIAREIQSPSPRYAFVLTWECCIQRRPVRRVEITDEQVEQQRAYLESLRERLRFLEGLAIKSIETLAEIQSLRQRLIPEAERELRRRRTIAGRLQDAETGQIYVRFLGQVRGPRIYNPVTGELIGRPRLWVAEGISEETQEKWIDCFRKKKAAKNLVEYVIYYDYTSSTKERWDRHLEVRIRMYIPVDDDPLDYWDIVLDMADRLVDMLYGELISFAIKRYTRDGYEIIQKNISAKDMPKGVAARPLGVLHDDRGYIYKARYYEEMQEWVLEKEGE